MNHRKLFASSLCSFASLACLLAPKVYAADFSAGDLVVVLDGDGVASLSSAASAAFLREYSSTTLAQASPIQSIALPTAASGGSGALTLSGSASSEGFLSISADGNYLVMGGYNAAPGTAGVVTATPTTVNRVVGMIDMHGNVNTTTVLTDAYNGSNIRSATALNGTTIWTGGNAGSGQGASAGIRSTTFGASTSLQLNSSSSNMRVVKAFNGQLYTSSSTGALLGISTVGSGLPTAAGSGPLTLLPGMPTSGTHSSYDFWFKDSSTLYVADDGAVAAGGGIQKWVLNAGTWSLSYTLLNNGTTTTGVRGLVGNVDGSGNVDLFATTSTASANSLIEVTDTGASATSSILATAPANTDFRGVEFIPPVIPEPSTMALLGLGSVIGCYFFGRRNQK